MTSTPTSAWHSFRLGGFNGTLFKPALQILDLDLLGGIEADLMTWFGKEGQNGLRPVPG